MKKIVIIFTIVTAGLEILGAIAKAKRVIKKNKWWSQPLNKQSSEKPLGRATGFTFIEILVVLVILALLVGIVSVQIFGEVDKAKVDTTRLQMRSLQTSLDLYRLHNSFYPTTEQGLNALLERPAVDPLAEQWQGPYLKSRKLPADGWKRPFVYSSSDGREYEIVSYGADGRQGGDEESADISSNDF